MTFYKLVKHIQEYESDTFTAKGAEITKAEAVRVVENLLESWVANHLDGAVITGILGSLRA